MKTTTRFLAIFLVFVMLVGVLPLGVFAVNASDEWQENPEREAQDADGRVTSDVSESEAAETSKDPLKSAGVVPVAAAYVVTDDAVALNLGDWISVPEVTKYVYQIDTDGVDVGGSYLIAAGEYDVILLDNGDNSVGKQQVTIDNGVITLDQKPTEWTITSAGKIVHGTKALEVGSSALKTVEASGSNEKWTFTRSGKKYSVLSFQSDRYIYYNTSKKMFVGGGSTSTVRLFKGGEETTPAHCLAMTNVADLIFPIGQFTSQSDLETELQKIVQVYRYEGETAPVEGTDISAMTTLVTDFSLVPDKSVDTAAEGEYIYTVTAEGYSLGTFKVTIKEAVQPIDDAAAQDDAVVIDYGLPVNIHVLGNDLFGTGAEVVGIGVGDLPAAGFDLNAAAADALTLNFGSAKKNADGTVTYTPGTMQMNGAEKFWYAVKNTDAEGLPSYRYANVTVVPATTIYYEDSFVTFSDEWKTVGEEIDGTQSEDRPGSENANVYGYDGAYSDCMTYSLGSARKVTVSTNNANLDETIKATFTFTGTAFDIISLTSTDTGTVAIKVYDEKGALYTYYVVNTFYGYTPTGPAYYKYVWIHHDGAWYLKNNERTPVTEEEYKAHSTETTLPTGEAIVDGKEEIIYEKTDGYEIVESGTNNALYQIPVIKSETFPYGTYTVEIIPKYSDLQDMHHDGSYDFYLDAIRIYNPANEIPADIYVQDDEGYPEYFEVRNNLISDKTFNNNDETVSGIVFIDLVGNTSDISKYQAYGPNNEVYLKGGQAIAFKFEADPANIASIQLGMKAVNASVRANVNGNEFSIATSTDMYYDITKFVHFADGATMSDTVIISNPGTGDTILSVTNIKITYKVKPAPAQAKMVFSMSHADALAAVQAFSNALRPAVPAPVVIFGDFNTDGKINGHDLSLLRKYFANYDYSTGTSSFVIKDWNPTVRDLAKLRKYLAGYDYDTGTSSFILVPDVQ